MRFLVVGVLVILVILLGVQIYSFEKQSGALAQQSAELKTQLDKAENDFARLTSDYQYLQNPANLEKELRARFNYKTPDEKMIILVPAQTSGSITTTP